jgi:hypothetical protein
MIRMFLRCLTTFRLLLAIAYLCILSQSALAVRDNHDYWADYLLIPPSAVRSQQYLSSGSSVNGNSSIATGNNHKIANTIPASVRSLSAYSGNVSRAYGRSRYKLRGIDERLLYFLDTLESLDTSSLELRIGGTIFDSPSFRSYKSSGLRLYSTSIDWRDPEYPEPVKIVLSVYRDRTIAQPRNIPSAMLIMYTKDVPTKERTIIGYGKYGIYATLTLLWERREQFPGTSFLQFGAAHENPFQIQPFYDPDLKELTYHHQSQWIAAGWRVSDLSSLKTVAKYLYYTFAGK